MNGVLVTGASGLVGSAVVRKLEALGVGRIYAPPHDELDLTDERAVNLYFSGNDIQYVVHCAAAVGGIRDNSYTKYDKLYVNQKINSNVINAFREKCDAGQATGRLLFVGSMCAYPDTPYGRIGENMLLRGPVERQNEGYALSKIFGIKMCQYLCESDAYRGRFVSCMPANVYGPNDRFDEAKSHLIPATIAKIRRAMTDGAGSISVFGHGRQVRSFVYSDDLASAIAVVLDRYEGPDPVNIGPGFGYQIREIVGKIADIMGFDGKVLYGDDEYGGSAYRVENSDRMFSLGWEPEIGIDEGLKLVIDGYLRKENNK